MERFFFEKMTLRVLFELQKAGKIAINFYDPIFNSFFADYIIIEGINFVSILPFENVFRSDTVYCMN